MILLCILLEALCQIFIISGMEKRVRADWKKAVVYVVVLLAFLGSVNIFHWPEILSVFSYLLFYLYIRWNYGENAIRAFVLMIISFILIVCMEMVISGILFYICRLDSTTILFNLCVTGCSALLCGLLSILFPIYRIPELLDRWEKSYSIVCFLSLMVLVPVVAIKISDVINLSGYFYILVCVAVMWFLIWQIQKYKSEEKIRKQYYDGYAEVISQIRRSQHKFKNQLNVIASMHQVYHSYDELVHEQEDYMGRLCRYELPSDAIILEEPAVIAIIYEKINEAYDAGIEVETNFKCSLSGTRVSDVVWADVLGVVLDNAIEAVKECQDDGKIWISFWEEEGRIRIEIANTYRYVKVTELMDFGKEGFSTKGEEGRGIGLYHIKNLIRKNRGNFVIGSKKISGRDCVVVTIDL